LTKSELIQADKRTADKATTAVTCAAARADIPQRLAPSSLRPENICGAKPGSHETLIAKGENGETAPDQASLISNSKGLHTLGFEPKETTPSVMFARGTYTTARTKAA
ncbi:3 beta-hydroxysteroid dehydrogenase type 7-like protein, partial [Corchorus capsularis]